MARCCGTIQKQKKGSGFYRCKNKVKTSKSFCYLHKNQDHFINQNEQTKL